MIPDLIKAIEHITPWLAMALRITHPLSSTIISLIAHSLGTTTDTQEIINAVTSDGTAPSKLQALEQSCSGFIHSPGWPNKITITCEW